MPDMCQSLSLVYVSHVQHRVQNNKRPVVHLNMKLLILTLLVVLSVSQASNLSPLTRRLDCSTDKVKGFATCVCYFIVSNTIRVRERERFAGTCIRRMGMDKLDGAAAGCMRSKRYKNRRGKFDAERVIKIGNKLIRQCSESTGTLVLIS